MCDDDFVTPFTKRRKRELVEEKPCSQSQEPKKQKREWSAPTYFPSLEDFQLFQGELIGRFLHQRTNKYTCNICPVNPSFHNMSRKYFKCDNKDCECEVEEPDCVCLKCTAEMKVVTCFENDRTRMVGVGNHLTSCYTVQKAGLSLNTKKFIDKVKQQHKLPNFGASKVREALLDEGFLQADLPPVTQVQNYLNYKQTSNSSHHDIEAFQKQLSDMTPMHARETHDTFVFGTLVEPDGSVVVGSGHENSHFNVSFTSRALLANIKKAQDLNNANEWKMPFCIDFTFKTNLLGFFFGVMGVVDAGRHFFLGALTLLSHKSTEDYVTCVGDFKDVCASEGKFSLDPFYCMLDGEAAIQNALRQLFTNVSMILMCFFHVMKNCKEHLKGVSEQLKKKILKKIRALHMSRNSIEFQLCLEAFSHFF